MNLKHWIRMILGTVLIFCVFMTTNAKSKSNGVDYGNVIDSYQIIGYSETIDNIVHYPTDETKKWNIGVINTKNTAASLEYIAPIRDKCIKYKNYGFAADLDTDYLFANIHSRLKKTFKNIIAKQTVSKEDQDVDYYVYLDLQTLIGSRSYQATNIVLNLYFVNKNNEYLGKISVDGTGAVAYPAFSAGFKDATKELSDDLNVFLEGGLDFIKR